jgi:hypothetical protein
MERPLLRIQDVYFGSRILILGPLTSVADSGCFFRIPDFFHPGPLFPDSTTSKKKRKNKVYVLRDFVTIHFSELYKILIFFIFGTGSGSLIRIRITA